MQSIKAFCAACDYELNPQHDSAAIHVTTVILPDLIGSHPDIPIDAKREIRSLALCGRCWSKVERYLERI